MGGNFVVGSHHFARAFAAIGHSVIHVSAPVSIAHLATIFRGSFTRTRFLRCLSGGAEFEGVRDIVPFTLVPWKLTRWLPRLMNICSTLMATSPFRGFSLKSIRNADWLIVDDPRLVGLATKGTQARLAYRATDLYTAMTNDPTILRAERVLCLRADLLVATSNVVAQHLWRLCGRHVHVITNGVDLREVSDPKPPLPTPGLRLPGRRQQRAVYVGSFDDRFGIGALRAAAESLPDKEFILIGPGSTMASKAINKSNVTALGPVPYSRLPSILAQCAIGLLPLSAHPANAGRSPMKLYEYAAAGLPVAATSTEELSRRILATLSLAESDKEFPEAVHRAFEQSTDGALVEAGRQEARRESWVAKSRELLDLLNLDIVHSVRVNDRSNQAKSLTPDHNSSAR